MTEFPEVIKVIALGLAAGVLSGLFGIGGGGGLIEISRLAESRRRQRVFQSRPPGKLGRISRTQALRRC